MHEGKSIESRGGGGGTLREYFNITTDGYNGVVNCCYTCSVKLSEFLSFDTSEIVFSGEKARNLGARQSELLFRLKEKQFDPDSNLSK